MKMRGALESKRYWLPLGGGFACLIVALWVAPIVAWLLLILSFGLLLDGCTAWFAKSGSTGGLRDYKQ